MRGTRERDDLQTTGGSAQYYRNHRSIVTRRECVSHFGRLLLFSFLPRQFDGRSHDMRDARDVVRRDHNEADVASVSVVRPTLDTSAGGETLK